MKVNITYSAVTTVDIPLTKEEAKFLENGEESKVSDETIERIMNAMDISDSDEVEIETIWR